MAGTNAQTWNSYEFFQPIPQPPPGIVRMANELIDRIGEKGYRAWCEQELTDSDEWGEIGVKMEAKLEALSIEVQIDVHAWSNKPEHYKMNGVY